MPKFSAFLGGDTQQTYRLIARFFSFFKRTQTQRWTWCSGCRNGTEGVHSKILWIIKEEMIYVVLDLGRTSVGPHPTGPSPFQQQIIVTLTYVKLPWSHRSRRHPAFVFSAILLISDPKVKSPSIARSTSTKASNKPSTSRGVSHRPVASPGPVFTSDGWIRRQPCGRCGSNPRCLRNTSLCWRESNALKERGSYRRLCCSDAALSLPYAVPFTLVTWVRVHLSSFRPQRRRHDLYSLSCVVR